MADLTCSKCGADGRSARYTHTTLYDCKSNYDHINGAFWQSETCRIAELEALLRDVYAEYRRGPCLPCDDDYAVMERVRAALAGTEQGCAK